MNPNDFQTLVERQERAAREAELCQQASIPVQIPPAAAFSGQNSLYPDCGDTVESVRDSANAVVGEFLALQPKYYAALRLLDVLDRNPDVETLFDILSRYEF